MSQYSRSGIAMAVVAAAAIYTAGVASGGWTWRLVFLAVAVVAVGATVVLELMNQSEEFRERVNQDLVAWLDAGGEEKAGERGAGEAEEEAVSDGEVGDGAGGDGVGEAAGDDESGAGAETVEGVDGTDGRQ